MSVADRTHHEGPRCNLLLYWLGTAYLRLAGWRIVGVLPPARKMLIIGAPHTSNWDFPHMLLVVSAFRLKVCWLGKHTLFVPPFSWVLRALGGIPTDRGTQSDLVRRLADRFATEDRLALVMAPEGTRTRTDHWRSGFYAIAQNAGLEIVCGYIDYATREIGMGLSFRPGGSRRADMDLLRDFYRGKRGRHPELASEVRLLDES